MRRALFSLALLACALAALPSQAGAAQPKNRYVPYYDVSIRGTITESWKVDRAVSDHCGRETTGSGGATIRFATPKPKRTSLHVDTGFHSRPPVDVTIDRRAAVTTSPGFYPDCAYPAPSTAGCGVKSFSARAKLAYGSPFHPSIDAGDKADYGQLECPSYGPGLALLQRWGPKIKQVRLLLYTCRRRACRHKRTNVVTVKEHVDEPLSGERGERGTYSADIEWQVKFFWVNPYRGGVAR